MYINALLASGWVPDLFPKDELDALLQAPGALRAEAKAQVGGWMYGQYRAAFCVCSSGLFSPCIPFMHPKHTDSTQGVPDTPAALLAFLIQRVRSNLHVVLTFSPVGQAFR